MSPPMDTYETRDPGDQRVDLPTTLSHRQGLRVRRPSSTRENKDISKQSSTASARNPTGSQKQGRNAKSASKKRRIKRWGGRTSWMIPLALILGLASLYALNPTESNIVHPFIFLSYRIKHNKHKPESQAQAQFQFTDDTASVSSGREYDEYGKGPRDIAFVAFYVLVLFFLRAFIMREVLRPLARFLGITSRSKRGRFNEQMYVAIYTGIVGPLGVYVYFYMTRTMMYHSHSHSHSPSAAQHLFPSSFFSTADMYEGYPHKTHSAGMKFYYLLQAAFWAQQALVMILGLETRRKDFRELVVHHVVTVALIALSYRFHFTVMGVLVYVTHDISDFFLATSKSLNYIDHPLQIPYYALCILVWVYLRHYINLRILYSVLTEFRAVGPYVLDWAAEQYKCGISQVITFTLLAALQALNLFWLYCLLRNAYRFVVYGIAKDDREEDEEGDKIDGKEVEEKGKLGTVEEERG